MGFFSAIGDAIAFPFQRGWDLVSSTVGGFFDGGSTGASWGAWIMGAVGVISGFMLAPAGSGAFGALGWAAAGGLGGAMVGGAGGSILGAALGSAGGAIGSGLGTLTSLIPGSSPSPTVAHSVAPTAPAPGAGANVASADPVTPLATPAKVADNSGGGRSNVGIG